MEMTGIIMLDGKPLNTAKKACGNKNMDFHDSFAETFTNVCRELEIPVPMWLDKNTKELAMCRKTSFLNDQFYEPFKYDSFILRIDKMY